MLEKSILGHQRPGAYPRTLRRGACKLAVAVATVVLSAMLIGPSLSAAATQVAPPGKGAGQVSDPQGMATDFASGMFYVADRGNNRIDVFDAAGEFQNAFGWSVRNLQLEAQVCTFATTCREGSVGDGKGQFNRPTDVAVDNDPLSSSFRDVYVVDYENLRIEKFDTDGNFLLTFGGGVNKTDSSDVCVEGSGDTCGAGGEGSGDGEFTRGGVGFKLPISIGVGPSGVVYVLDNVNESGIRKIRLQKFDASGTFLSAQVLGEHDLSQGGMSGESLAVNADGGFYEVRKGIQTEVRRYDVAGSSVEAIPSIGSRTVAVDSSGNLFVAALDSVYPVITEYENGSLGAIVRRFGYGEFGQQPKGIVSASDKVLVSEGSSAPGRNQVLEVPFPDPGPLIVPAPCSVQAGSLSNIRATLFSEINPEGDETHYHYEYITDEAFDENLAAGESRFTGGTRFPENPADDPSAGSEFSVFNANLEVTGLVPETKYHCRAVAENASGIRTGEEGEFETREAMEFGPAWTTEVESTTASLNAEVNPLGIATTAHFEYVDDATFKAGGLAAQWQSEFEAKEASETPAPGVKRAPLSSELDYGTGEEMSAASTGLSDLAPGTLYHYRLVADNALVLPRPGEARTFRTFSTARAPVPPDNRGYELVSPPQKNSAEVVAPAIPAGLANNDLKLVQAGSDDGETLTYTSFTSFGADPKGAQGASQYISRRTPTGWQTKNITPFGFVKNALRPPFRGFSPNLEFAAFVIDSPPCAPGALSGFESLCLLDTATGSSRPLVLSTPPVVDESEEAFCFGYGGASADGSRVFFAANGAIPTTTGPAAKEGKGFSLYESSSEGLRLVNVLPSGNALEPQPGTAFGASPMGCSMGQQVVANAVSTDGQRAFWTYAQEGTPTRLYVRINHSQTVQVDGRGPGAPDPAGSGRFLAATPNGSHAFFDAANRLTGGARPGSIYRYDVAADQLQNLLGTGTEPAGVQGVLGVSDDGTYAYFVASAVLTGEQESPRGEKAEPGEANLYRWHEGEGLRFVARLASTDGDDWSENPSTHTARVSADGRYVAFLSRATESLVGYDNTLAVGSHCEPAKGGEFSEGGPACAQAFLYQADSEELHCASCNPSGERPLGPSMLPTWSNPFEGPRYLSEDGSRLFFESFDSLTPADKNGKGRDVYEAELPGIGSCDASSPAFVSSSGLCVFLISSGTSEDETYLVDASSSGDDVSIATRSQLVPWADQNGNYDLYDARVGGGFPEPPVSPICEGEGCRPPALLPPGPALTATDTFAGPGNQKPRCVKKKGKKHRKMHRAHSRRQGNRHRMHNGYRKGDKRRTGKRCAGKARRGKARRGSEQRRSAR